MARNEEKQLGRLNRLLLQNQHDGDIYWYLLVQYILYDLIVHV